ncbi:hypothetical protein [Methanocaldococcus sp.]
MAVVIDVGIDREFLDKKLPTYAVSHIFNKAVEYFSGREIEVEDYKQADRKVVSIMIDEELFDSIKCNAGNIINTLLNKYVKTHDFIYHNAKHFLSRKKLGRFEIKHAVAPKSVKDICIRDRSHRTSSTLIFYEYLCRDYDYWFIYRYRYKPRSKKPSKTFEKTSRTVYKIMMDGLTNDYMEYIKVPFTVLGGSCFSRVAILDKKVEVYNWITQEIVIPRNLEKVKKGKYLVLDIHRDVLMNIRKKFDGPLSKALEYHENIRDVIIDDVEKIGKQNRIKYIEYLYNYKKSFENKFGDYIKTIEPKLD